ncbi:MAG TPA: lysozyme inhibitor LprI family protein [Pseudomonas sp.]|uniref:lysozyme inhibitor LprI family protein n=1 Tax=Pseudomonas sp. TaxID=306 RepID=UPI002B48E472|nr:lysozyme inhibitor LprI family protein [Pseudomonas sp.]HKS13663.1 lysozyme inhibitor LprI family protein [Pseudomonas sp.]
MLKRYLLAATAALTLDAHAQDYSPSYTRCMENASSTVAMSTCIQSETQAQDARLNTVYKQLMATLDSAPQKRLREAQRSWIKYRESNCGFYSRMTGGSIDRIQGPMCELDMRRERAVELERVLNPER